MAGLHRSPLRGHSLEFAQHREYVPGDDLRLVDWKVYAKTDRYYLKQFEDETNFTAYLLLDVSESMNYRGPKSALSKLEYAQLIIFSLAYLIVAQQDSVGLATFADELLAWLPPAGHSSHLDDVLHVISQPSGQLKTDFERVGTAVCQRCTKPGIVVIVSDLLGETTSLKNTLKQLRYQRHDTIVIHVLDESELQFPFDRPTLFQGLEGIADITADPLLIGNMYRQAMKNFCVEIAGGCQALGVDYHRIATNESLAASLPDLLARRLTHSR